MQTVGDLILELQGYDPNLPVITPGFDELGICSIETDQVEIYREKSHYDYQSDRLSFRGKDQAVRMKESTICEAILLTFGDAIKIKIAVMYVVKERFLSIIEAPPWVERDSESGDLCLFSDEDAFLDIPAEAEDLKDDSGNLDEVKLEAYLFKNYPECVEEHWVDKHAFSDLPAAHDYAEAQSFVHGFKIESVPLN